MKIIFLVTLICSTMVITNARDNLIPYRKGDLWGYASMDKTIRIEPQYDSVHLFFDNRAVVIKNGKYGLIDVNGGYILKPKYQKIANFQDGYSYIVDKGTSFRCDTLGNMSRKTDDTEKPGLEKEPGFNGLSIDFKSIIKNKKQGLENIKNGKKLPVVFDSLYFTDDVKQVYIIARRNNIYGILGYSFDTLINFEFNDIEHLNNNLFAVKKGNYAGLYEAGNKEIIPCIYDEINYFGFGVYQVKKGNKYGCVGENNEVYVPVEYDKLDFIDNDHVIVKQDNKWGIITTRNDIVEFIDYDAVVPLGNNYYKLKQDNKWAMAKYEYDVETPFIYDEIKRTHCSQKGYPWFFVRSGNKWGALDDRGRKIIPGRYEALLDIIYDAYDIAKQGYSCSEGFTFIQDGLFGFMDKKGNMIISNKYDDLKSISGFSIYIVLTCDGKWGYIDSEGNEFFE